ncbi:hypothetical protein ACLOJK_017161 [Asimina triloba]
MRVDFEKGLAELKLFRVKAVEDIVHVDVVVKASFGVFGAKCEFSRPLLSAKASHLQRKFSLEMLAPSSSLEV